MGTSAAPNLQTQFPQQPQVMQPWPPQQPAQQPAPVQQPAPAPLPNVNPRQLVPHGDPQWPQELWGRPIGEALQYYKVMREDFLRRKREEQEAARQGLRGEPQQQQPAQFQQPGLAGQPQPGWRQPQQPAQPSYIPPQQQPQAQPEQTVEQTIRRVLAELLPQVMAPVHKVSAEQAYQQVKREFSDWNQYHAHVLQVLQGATEEQLSEPDLWRNAYYAVKGRMLSQGGAPPQYQGNGDGNFEQPQNSNNGYAPGSPIQTPPPAWDFVEAPSQQQQGQPQGGSVTQDPRAIATARRFGIPINEYADHWGGRVPAPQRQQQGQPPQQFAQAPAQRFGG